MGDIIVVPEYQGKGIGRKIVEILIDKVRRPDENSGCGMFMWIKNN